MAASSKKRSKKKKKEPQFNPMDYKEIWLFLIIAISIFLFCSNLGKCGVAGKVISGFLFGIFGWTEYIVPFYILTICVLGLYANDRPNTRRIIFWLGVAMIAVSFTFQIAGRTDFIGVKQMFSEGKNQKIGGGVIFGGLLKYINKYIGKVGSIIITVLLFIIAFIQITGVSLINLFKSFFSVLVIRDDYEEYDDYEEDEGYDDYDEGISNEIVSQNRNVTKVSLSDKKPYAQASGRITAEGGSRKKINLRK